MSNTNDGVFDLSQEDKVALLQEIISRKRKNVLEVTITQSEITHDIPLSAAQKRLWFLDQLEGPNPVYNVSSAFQIVGTLNINLLEVAFKQVIQQHNILRTFFTQKNGRPYQQIENKVAFSISTENIDSIEFHRISAEYLKIPFDLNIAPLLKVYSFSCTNFEHIILLVMHHIITDGWSMHILLKEVTEIYSALVMNNTLELTPLTIQYSDYCFWESAWLDSLHSDQQINYWLQKLKGTTHLQLPKDKKRPQKQTYHGKIYRSHIDKSLTNQVKQLGNQFKTTLFIVLMTVFNILLQRHSGQSDIIIATSTANRNNKKLENLIGFFVNMLPLRNNVDQNKTFIELLREVNDNFLQAYDAQNIPLDAILEKLNLGRNLSYNPLFQVEFVLQNFPSIEFNLPGLSMKEISLDAGVSKFDISFLMFDSQGSLNIEVEYSTDIFDESSIERLVNHYRTLLSSIIQQPNIPVKQLSIMTDNEYRLLLQEWSGENNKVKNNISFLQFFSMMLSKNDNKIAIRHNDSEVTYNEIDIASDQLANTLRINNIRQTSRVAIFMDRGIPFIVTMIACFKIGAIFTPMNPSNVSQQNLRILNHLEPNCIVTLANHRNTLIALEYTSFVIDYDEAVMHGKIDTLSSIDTSEFDLDSIAYIMYTSGTTGEPKGVMVKHRGMINHMLAKIEDIKILPEDSIAQIAVQTFDVFVWQCLLALMCGGTTNVITAESAWDPQLLLTIIQDHKITILESVPSHIELLLNTLEKSPASYTLASLKVLITNGEPMPIGQMRRWFKLFPNKILVNAYGPTECSDDVTHLTLTEPVDYNMPNLPLGKPIRNTQVYILDESLRPVPIGVAGEIYISGECLSAGYFKDNIKTQNSFIKCEITSDNFKECYKSGDQARYNNNGDIEYLGRCDFQLKIRGQRIETGEIESILLTHPAITQALVLGIKDGTDTIKLIAYVIIEIRPAPSNSTLLKYFEHLLPHHMLPQQFIVLDNFPLLHNGKVNRSALPIPSTNLNTLLDGYIAPTNDQEKNIVKIWEEILEKNRVGIEDNFFHLGGHSLLAVEAVSRMKDIIGDKMSLEYLFKYLTIRQILQAIVIAEKETIGE